MSTDPQSELRDLSLSCLNILSESDSPSSIVNGWKYDKEEIAADLDIENEKLAVWITGLRAFSVKVQQHLDEWQGAVGLPPSN